MILWVKRVIVPEAEAFAGVDGRTVNAVGATVRRTVSDIILFCDIGNCSGMFRGARAMVVTLSVTVPAAVIGDSAIVRVTAGAVVDTGGGLRVSVSNIGARVAVADHVWKWVAVEGAAVVVGSKNTGCHTWSGCSGESSWNVHNRRADCCQGHK